MGLVLAFETASRPSSRPSSRRAAKPQGADILFFTGVRYERQGQRSAEAPRPAQPCELPTSRQ